MSKENKSINIFKIHNPWGEEDLEHDYFKVKYVNFDCLKHVDNLTKKEIELRLIKILDRGSFGITYISCIDSKECKNEDQKYVIKLSKDTNWKKEFEIGKLAGEYEIAPKYYYAWRCDNELPDGKNPISVIVMERLYGNVLILNEYRKVSFETRKLIMLRLIELIHRLHKLEIIHGDLHSGNIFFSRDENDEVNLKLIDFGLSSKIESSKKEFILDWLDEEYNTDIDDETTQYDIDQFDFYRPKFEYIITFLPFLRKDSRYSVKITLVEYKEWKHFCKNFTSFIYYMNHD